MNDISRRKEKSLKEVDDIFRRHKFQLQDNNYNVYLKSFGWENGHSQRKWNSSPKTAKLHFMQGCLFPCFPPHAFVSIFIYVCLFRFLSFVSVFIYVCLGFCLYSFNTLFFLIIFVWILFTNVPCLPSVITTAKLYQGKHSLSDTHFPCLSTALTFL